MSYFQSINFDFVDGRYTLKLTNQFQSMGLSGVKGLEKSKITYRNELNTLSFPKFTAMDFNLFFTICYFLIKKNKKRKITTREITIKFDDLRVFLPGIKNKKRFYDEIVKFVKRKLRWVGVDTTIYNSIYDENKGVTKPLYSEDEEDEGSVFIESYYVSKKKEELYLEITPYGYSMLCEFGSFMSFDMKEFCSFENKYTKTLFRLLKQYENLAFHTSKDNSNAKVISMSKNEFMDFMDTPSDYKMSHLDCKVIIPSLNELNLKSSSYKNLDYEKIYDYDFKSKKIKGFQFIYEKITPNNL